VTRLALSILGVDTLIECAEPDTHALLEGTYGGMSGVAGRPALRYEIGRLSPSSPYVIRRDGWASVTAKDEAELLWALDDDVAIEIQKRRPDLYFVHAAVLELGGRAFMLVAESGTGKSTTAWALLHHGCGYLSDELGPVDLDSLTVQPYLRALCLKDEPPVPYPLPASALRTSRSIHVSTRDLPGPVWREPLGLEATFFLRYEPGASGPSVRQVTSAEGGARLYANTLNALAHQAAGLDGAIRIASGRSCFELVSAELAATAALVRRTVEHLLQGTARP
jgi:hypothetical protein